MQKYKIPPNLVFILLALQRKHGPDKLLWLAYRIYTNITNSLTLAGHLLYQLLTLLAQIEYTDSMHKVR